MVEHAQWRVDGRRDELKECGLTGLGNKVMVADKEVQGLLVVGSVVGSVGI